MGKSWLKYYLIKRIIYAIIIALGVVTITFVLLRIGPNSPADKYLANMNVKGQDVAQITAAIEARYGLDKPLWEQYGNYVINLFRGDWGWSFSTSMPVIDLIKKHWIYSFQLVLLSTVLAGILGILIGIYSAVRQYSKIDYAATINLFPGHFSPQFLAWSYADSGVFSTTGMV